MEQPILQVEHLTKFFSVGPHAEVHAVDDVNFTACAAAAPLAWLASSGLR